MKKIFILIPRVKSVLGNLIKVTTGAGENAQQLGTQASLEEDLSLVSRNHIIIGPTICILGNLMPSLASLGTRHKQTHKHMQTNTLDRKQINRSWGKGGDLSFIWNCASVLTSQLQVDFPSSSWTFLVAKPQLIFPHLAHPP